ncbi:MAG: hypothetical protein ABII06_07975 [Pseudomonadota bacterium]
MALSALSYQHSALFRLLIAALHTPPGVNGIAKSAFFRGRDFLIEWLIKKGVKEELPDMTVGII